MDREGRGGVWAPSRDLWAPDQCHSGCRLLGVRQTWLDPAPLLTSYVTLDKSLHFSGCPNCILCAVGSEKVSIVGCCGA